MKAYIYSKGDPSVGINGFSTEVDLGIEDFEDWDGQREGIRKILANTFINIWDDGKVTVMFDDELVDEPDYDDNLPDNEADAQTLAMAGWGTDEDYGHFGGYDE
jgi:hypothetical protein